MPWGRARVARTQRMARAGSCQRVEVRQRWMRIPDDPGGEQGSDHVRRGFGEGLQKAVMGQQGEAAEGGDPRPVSESPGQDRVNHEHGAHGGQGDHEDIRGAGIETRGHWQGDQRRSEREVGVGIVVEEGLVGAGNPARQSASQCPGIAQVAVGIGVEEVLAIAELPEVEAEGGGGGSEEGQPDYSGPGAGPVAPP